MKNKSIVVISLLVLVGLFIGALSFYKSNESSKLEKFASSGEPFVRPHSPTFGDNKKNVTVVEFLDPECEACGYFHGPVKAMFKEYYQDIKLVVRYLDNHKNSRFAIKLLETGKLQGKYKEVLDVIFTTQGKWAQHNNEKPQLLWQFLSEIEGLDFEKFKNDFKNIDVDEALSLDRKDAKTLGVRGTPTFFVNGKKLERLSQQALFDLVESEIYK